MMNGDKLQRRRYYVRRIVEIMQLLTGNELLFLGDYDSDRPQESGIFDRVLFQYISLKDDQLSNIQKEIPQICTCTSPEIQNDIIATMADMITCRLSSKMSRHAG